MAVVSRQENHLTTKQQQIYKCSLPDIFGLRKFWEKKYSTWYIWIEKNLGEETPTDNEDQIIVKSNTWTLILWKNNHITTNSSSTLPLLDKQQLSLLVFFIHTSTQCTSETHKHSADVGIHAGYSLSLSLKSSMMVTRPPIWLTIQTQESLFKTKRQPRASRVSPVSIHSSLIPVPCSSSSNRSQ